MRALGYPSQELLASWIDELEPGRRTKRADASRIPDKMKEKAVIDLVTREGSAKEVSDGLGAERAALYNWKRRPLDEEAPCKMTREPDAKPSKSSSSTPRPCGAISTDWSSGARSWKGR